MSVKSTFEDDSTTYHYATIKPIIHLIRIIAWKENYIRQSITSTLLWTFFWFHTSIVAYTLPIWIILALYYYCIDHTPNDNEPRYEDDMDKLTDELKEIQFELSLLLPSAESKDRFRRRSLFVLDQTYYYQALVFTVVYTVWICLLNVFGGRKIAWFLGCFVLTWKSPLAKVIRYSCHQIQFLYSKPSNKEITKSTIKPNSMTHQNDHIDRFYRFVIIEHQRWWLHCGWTSLLLPNERPEWSDEYLSEVPSTALFHLPPPTTKFDKLARKTIKTTWEWMSPEWQIDENHNVDKNGWEYGSWDWTAWSTKSSGLRVLTRRRHWIRNARLVKEEIKQTENRPVTLPIDIRKKSNCVSISTSLSSEDSFMCSTPTVSPIISLYTKSISTSTLAFNQSVEPTLFSDRHSTVDSQLWLRR